ncbi:MAG: DUF6382 domain-containing protein [Oribacterium sp.]|nr:DUF6382 domain-containing protein [Oribacterium sp.]
MKKYEVNLQNEGGQTFLVINLPEDAEVIPYCMMLVGYNHIPGILPMHQQFMNGESRFFYDISGKMSLDSFVKGRNMDKKMGMLLLENLTSAFQQLSEYLIGVEKLFLDPHYLYVGDGIQVFLPFVPITENITDNLENDLKKFYQDLLSKYLGVGNGNYNDMFMWIYNQEHFDLATFRKQFLSSMTGHQQAVSSTAAYSSKPVVQPSYQEAQQKPVMPSAYVSQQKQNINPAPKVHPQLQPQQNVKPNIPQGGLFNTGDGKSLNIPGQKPSFAVPGMQQAPQASDSPLQEKETGKKGLLGGILKKKNIDESNNQSQIASASPKQEAAPLQGLHGQASGKASFSGTAPMIVHRGQPCEIMSFPFLIGQGAPGVVVNYSVPNAHVSHVHASIEFSNGKYYIVDHASTNGTFVNGKRIGKGETVELHDGDTFRLYDEDFRFYIS